MKRFTSAFGIALACSSWASTAFAQVPTPAATQVSAQPAPAQPVLATTPATTATQTPPPSTPEASQPARGDTTEGGQGTPASTEAPTPPATDATPSAATNASESEGESRPDVTLSGYAEAYYLYNFTEPTDGYNAYRYYDTQHNHFALNNVVLDAAWSVGRVSGHVALQFGSITEYGIPFPRSVDEDLLWRLIQEVTFKWSPRVVPDHDLEFEAGLFVAPFTIEEMAVNQNWNWSVSNLFYAAPLQIMGARASYALTPSLTLRAGAFGGWEQVVRAESSSKSGLVQLEYDGGDRGYVTLNYMFGNDRPTGDPAGPYLRHTVDLYGEYQVSPRFALRANFFGGLQPNRDTDMTAWAGLALYARVQPVEWLYIATRLEALGEFYPSNAQSIFFGDSPEANNIASGTLTFDFRPHRNISLRVEYRHDHSIAGGGGRFNGNMFFRDAGTLVPGMTGMMGMPDVPDAYVPNATSQDTILAGATSWF